MNCAQLTRMELSYAVARGVRQLVLIGIPGKPRVEVTDDSGDSLQVFAVDEQDRNDFGATFVPTRFQSELLSSALGRSSFDKLKASLLIWLGDACYQTAEAILCTLSFISSLPKGSGVIFDYAEHGC